MLPLAIGAGAGGEIQAALARAVIGGLTVSTLITLLVIPAVYTGIHDLRERARRGRSGSVPDGESTRTVDGAG
jgi:HAE1 family hydrophobic/amphiphilic exporter-1